MVAPGSAVVAWCGGLKVVGYRFVLADDAQRAEERWRRYRRRGIFSILSIPAAILFIVGFTALIEWIMEKLEVQHKSALTATGFVFCAVIAVAGILAIVFTVHSATYFSRAASIRRGISGRILICEGESGLADPAIARIAGGRSLLRIEVLANSGLLWKLNDASVDDWIFLTHGQTAPPEPTPQPAVPMPAIGPRHVGAMRTLSEVELNELRAYVAPVTSRVIVVAIIWNLAAVAAIAALIYVPVKTPRQLWVNLSWTALIAYSALAYDRRFVLRRQMLVDLEGHHVIRQREPNGVSEILPRSRQKWTVDSVPAKWRRRGSRLFPGASDNVLPED